MKLIKKILAFFSPLEVIVLLSALTISTFLIIPAFTNTNPPLVNPSEEEGYMSLLPLLPSEVVYNTNGSRVQLFDTSFVVYYDSEATDAAKEGVINTLNELIVPHHKLFDRHNDYFAIAPLNPSRPTAEEIATLPRLINLKYVNDHKDETHEIAKPLYDLLMFGKEYSLLTPANAFNIFIGHIYDFWSPHIGNNFDPTADPLNNVAAREELERLQSFIPLSVEDINNTLVLSSSNDKYYARLNSYKGSSDFSISVGAIAKGLMTDILKEALLNRGLTSGYINGGASSITLLQATYGGVGRNFYMASINGSAMFSYKFSRTGLYRFSTSGIYEGKRFMYDDTEIIRSHIINPQTGYPIQHSHHLVNVASTTLSGMELDYLTTALTVLSATDGLLYLEDKFREDDVNIAYAGIDDLGLFVRRNHGYPGGENAKMEVFTPYRETFLDFL